MVSKGEREREQGESEERLSLSGLFFARGSLQKATSIVATIRPRFRRFLFGAVQMTNDAREHGWHKGQSTGGATAGAAPISEFQRVEIAIGGRGRRRPT